MHTHAMSEETLRSVRAEDQSDSGCRLRSFGRKGSAALSFLVPSPMKKSILLRTLYLIAVGSCFTLLALGAIRYIADYSHSRAEIRHKGNAVAERLASALALPLWDFNEEQIRATILLELTDPDVIAVTTSPPHGGTSGFCKNAAGVPESITLPDERTTLSAGDSVASKVVTYRETALGTITVYMSYSSAAKRVSLAFLIDFLILLLAAGAIAGVVFLTLKKNVIDPVIFLQESVINLSRKDFSTRIAVSSDDEIGSLASSFNQMAATIEDYNHNLQSLVRNKTDQLIKAERLAAAGALVAGMAHEINTPLGTALTAISHDKQLIEEIESAFAGGTMTKESFRRFIGGLRDGVDLTNSNLHRAAVLIDMFKRVAIDDSTEDRELFSVKNIICETIYSIEPHFSGKAISVTVLCSDDLTMTGHPRLFSQIVANLMMNTVMHAFAGRDSGMVRITVEKDPERLSLTFADDGSGIEQGILDRIFDPFFTTRRNQGGTGLGLTIVHNIVHHNFGGEIFCRSTPGAGTVITIHVPVFA